MEGINHSSRERHSWSDRKGREGWNGIKTFCPPSDRKELCPDHVPLHPSGLFNRGTARPAIALCAHWQHSIIRPRQLQPSTPNDWRIRRARDRETWPPLRSTPPCSSVSPRGGQSSTLSSPGTPGLLGIDRRKGEFRIEASSTIRIYFSVDRSFSSTFSPRSFHFLW